MHNILQMYPKTYPEISGDVGPFKILEIPVASLGLESSEFAFCSQNILDNQD